MSSREILQGPINPQVCVTVSALKESRGLWRRGATGCNNMPLSHPYPYLPGLPDGLISPYHANAQRPRRRCCCVDRAAFRGDASGIVNCAMHRPKHVRYPRGARCKHAPTIRQRNRTHPLHAQRGTKERTRRRARRDVPALARVFWRPLQPAHSSAPALQRLL